MIATLEHKILGYNVNANKDQLNKINDATNVQRQEKVSRIFLVYKGIAKTIRSFYIKIKESILSGSFFKKRRIYKYYNPKEDKEFLISNTQISALQSQIKGDQTLISKSHAVRVREITQIALRGWLGSNLDRELTTEISISTYATTYRYFAPIIYDWVIHLLQRAKEDKLHLVFMARDGLCPYRAAKSIQIRTPELNNIPISYVYLSRKVVQGDQQNLQEYLRQELNQESLKSFLFIDIGFCGTMVDTITSAMHHAIPNSQCQFQFLISTGKKVSGFVASAPNSMRALKSAGKNRAAYWIEDTHQGNIPSPTKLVKDGNGKLQPNTLVDQKLLSENPATAILRETALNAVNDYVTQRNFRADLAKKRSAQLSQPLRKKIEQWLEKVRQERFLYIDHN